MKLDRPSALPGLVAILALAAGSAWSQPAGAPVVRGSPAMHEALEGQRAAYDAYQKCMADNRAAYQLYTTANDVISARQQRAMFEAGFLTNPKARERFPGGYEQFLAEAFERYRAAGGKASRVADVTPEAAPCTTPVQARPVPGTNQSLQTTETRKLPVVPVR